MRKRQRKKILKSRGITIFYGQRYRAFEMLQIIATPANGEVRF